VDDRLEKSKELFLLGTRSLQDGDLDRAETCLSEALELAPGRESIEQNLSLVLCSKADRLSDNSEFDNALKFYDRSIFINRRNPIAWNNKGVLLRRAFQNLEAAMQCFFEAVNLFPEFSDALLNLGATQADLGLLDAALRSLSRALEVGGNSQEALLKRCEALYGLERYEEALCDVTRAIELNPTFTEGLIQRGSIYSKLKRFPEAFADFDKAISLNPNLVEAWNNRALTFGELKLFDKALQDLTKALEISPNFAEGWNNRGGVHQSLLRPVESLRDFTEAARLDPESEFVLGNLIRSKQLVCDWAGLPELKRQAERALLAGKRVMKPFFSLGTFDSPELQQLAAKLYVDGLESRAAIRSDLRVSDHGKLRVGYFSMDFKEHPVAYLIAEVIELHRRDKFEVVAFSFSEDKSPMRARLAQSFDDFLDVSLLDDAAVAELSHKRGIDIAIDLGGHTLDARPELFLQRVAPIQVSFLGYPATWGHHCMDYIIGDRIVFDSNIASHMSEKLVTLPQCFQPNDRRRPLPKAPPESHRPQFPENSFVFCCFNNTWKISPETFRLWMKILQQTKDGVLWLYADNALARENLRDEAIKLGISEGRLFFSGRLERAAYINQFSLADLFLDTLPYNGGTTVSDALWAGLPVLTQTGRSFPSRMAASLLEAVGLQDLVTNCPESYVARAVSIGSSRETARALKELLRDSGSSSPLFDTVSFVRNLESAFLSMAETFARGDPPQNIQILNEP